LINRKLLGTGLYQARAHDTFLKKLYKSLFFSDLFFWLFLAKDDGGIHFEPTKESAL
jgi:hypothetical protein